MNPEDAIQIANAVLVAHSGTPLTDVQCVIIRESLAGKGYKEMKGYTIQHFKNEGSQLWHLLSEACGETIKKSNVRIALEKRLTSYHQTRCDWGSVSDVPVFWGRIDELTRLTQWINTDRCRLIALIGMGGIGKTALGIKVAEQVAETFDFVIWRSLRESPMLDTLMLDLIKILSHQTETALPQTVDAAIAHLLHYLQGSRCLLVLDNVEALFQPGAPTGTYREEYGQVRNFL